MNKVMTRTKRHPGTRPPGRQDTRGPGSAPPRAPGAPRRTPGGSPPPPSPGTATLPGPPGTGSPRPTAPGTASGTSAPGTSPRTSETGPYSRSAPAVRPGPRTAPARGRTATATATAEDTAVTAPGGDVPLGAPVRGAGRTAPQPRPTDLFAERLVAVLSGRRPVHCMLRHTVGRAYDELAWLAERSPLRTRGTQPVVRDIGYYVPRRGAIEAFARIGAGDQLRAMAFRLEQGPDLRWRCTAVELGGPRMPHD
ncbi:Rv3235 family protein [Streptomyces sp. NPDC005813]|uniref:Rv3235 family protein n=1 Tax=Streptomyces sp. NPDC005813 TaxID=3155592 RepID=UPI0033E7AFD8